MKTNKKQIILIIILILMTIAFRKIYFQNLRINTARLVNSTESSEETESTEEEGGSD